MSLDQTHCVPCQIGAPTLNPPQIEELKSQINSEWEVADYQKLIRKLKFPDFKAAIAFINKVADIAEAEGHHPNIHLTGWNKVQLELYTHKISGLHRNDFIVASKIDKLLS